MGQKVNPIGFRLGTNVNWKSRWFADDKRYKHLLFEDVKLREVLQLKLKNAGLSHVEIDRSINKIDVTVFVSRPGIVIGRGGTGLEELKKFITKKLKKGDDKQIKIELKVEPVKEPNLNANIVGTMVADQLVRRMPHRRVVKQAIERVMGAGAKGVQIMLAGRIAGAEISRKEKYKQGSIPFSTIREEIDYASVPALTKSGYVGVKVWICKKSA